MSKNDTKGKATAFVVFVSTLFGLFYFWRETDAWYTYPALIILALLCTGSFRALTEDD